MCEHIHNKVAKMAKSLPFFFFTFGIREIKTTCSWLIVLFDNYCFVNLIEQFSFVTFCKSDVFILAVLTSLVHYQNHKNVLCKSYLSHKGLMHWKQADLCCLKKKWIHRYMYSSNSVALFCCCDAHLLNMLKITIIILIKLFCLISKYRIFTFTNSSFDF